MGVHISKNNIVQGWFFKLKFWLKKSLNIVMLFFQTVRSNSTGNRRNICSLTVHVQFLQTGWLHSAIYYELDIKISSSCLVLCWKNPMLKCLFFPQTVSELFLHWFIPALKLVFLESVDSWLEKLHCLKISSVLTKWTVFYWKDLVWQSFIFTISQPYNDEKTQ